MKISTKGRYGLRAMVDLAVHSTGGHISLRSIAERENISDHYLEQVFSTLRKAGLVKSVKGAEGGYVLTDHPSAITIGTILRVLEGSLSIMDTHSETENAEFNLNSFLTSVLWSKIDKSIDAVVDHLTLEDLVQEYHRVRNSDAFIYYI